MCSYAFIPIDDRTYSIHYAIYSDANIYMSYDFTELLEDFMPDGNGLLICKDGTPIGGITLYNNHISAPFLIPPFCSRNDFWRAVLDFAKTRCKGDIFFDKIQESNAESLVSLGAEKRWAQKRMCRPTSRYTVQLNEQFYFAIPAENDKDEIIQAVYESHLNGYTSIVYGTPNRTDVEEAINRRFVSFSQTNTLHLGTIVKDKEAGTIAAVCIAGIYPDSHNQFSTIHQVSVLPAYRRKGLAQAMILNTIDAASSVSSVIGLGVLAGNPAELLYRKIGFAPGPSYYDLIYSGA